MLEEVAEFDQSVLESALSMTGKYVKSDDGEKTEEKPNETEQNVSEDSNADPENKQETKEPAPDSVADENKAEEGQEVTKGVQKRIDTLTRQKKEAQEEARKLRAQLEEKDAPKEEPKYKLSDEQYREAVFSGAIEKVVAEDEAKPLEKRRVLSAEEMDELLTESPGKFSKWQNEFGNFEADLKESIKSETMVTKKAEKKANNSSNDFSYERFIEENPTLAFADHMKDLSPDIISDDVKLTNALKEKDEEVGEFFGFINDNREKYPDLKSLNIAAKDYYVHKGNLKTKNLEKQIEELKAENERLNNIDTGIKPSGHRSHEERKSSDLDSSIANVLSMAGYGG